MPLYALGDTAPQIHPDAFVHPEAVLIGDVTVGADSSIWPGAVLRGDNPGGVRIGASSSVQDGAVIHCTHEPTIVGDFCVIGHLAHLEACVIEDYALVGSGAVVLHAAVVRTGALVGAAALVPGKMEVPTGAQALGVPAKLRPDSATREMIEMNAMVYVAKCRQYRSALRRID